MGTRGPVTPSSLELVEQLSEFKMQFPQLKETSREYYNQVHVIHIHWDDDEDQSFIPQIMKEIAALQSVFDKYGYKTERLVLEAGQAVGGVTTQLEDAIKKHLVRLAKNDLLIVHYSGHGAYKETASRDSRTGMTEWTYNFDIFGGIQVGEQDDGTPIYDQEPVDFLQIRKQLLDKAEHDVLLLMDCCHASGAACGPLVAGKEILAASSLNEPSHVGERSFTVNIAQILEEAHDKMHIMPTTQICARLHGNFWTQQSPGAELRKLGSQPVHVALSPDARTPIILAPLHEVVSRYHPSLELDRVPRGKRSYADALRPTVIVECSVPDDNLDKDTLQRCFDKTGGFLGMINVLDVRRTGSFWVQLEIAIHTWLMLSRHPALRFVCIRGPDRLNPPDWDLGLRETKVAIIPGGWQSVLTERPVQAASTKAMVSTKPSPIGSVGSGGGGSATGASSKKENVGL